MDDKQRQCPTCRKGELHSGTTRWETRQLGHTFVEDVAADVCNACGEAFVSDEHWQRHELQVATLLMVKEPSGPALKLARKALALNQEQLAGILDLTVETLSRFESGTRKPGRQTLALVRLLLDDALNGSGRTRAALEVQTQGLPMVVELGQ